MPKNRMKLKNKGDFRFLSTLFRFTHHSYSIFVHFSPDDAVRFSVIYAVGADNEGTWLINRRLHQGRFQQLLSRTANSATEPLSVKELERYLDGEDIQVKRQGLLKN